MTSSTLLLAAPVVAPLLAAGIALLLSDRPSAQRVLGLVVVSALVLDAGVLLARVDGGAPVTLQAGGFGPTIGITLVADRFSALALLVALLVFLVVLVFAVGQGTAEPADENVPSVFHPTYLVLVAGISLVFVTGDLFTLYVGFEVMLMASYVLTTLGSTVDRVRSGMTYIVTSLTASILLLTAISSVYAVTGTVNLAQLGDATAALDGSTRQLLGLLLLVALGIKAAIVPLHFWLPDSYPNAPAPVTAVLAALLTKAGVYAIVRTQTVMFPREEPWGLMLVLAAVTMLVGAVGALVQHDVNHVLSFVLVSHIGFMLFGLGLSSTAGLLGTVIYLVHHITVQAALFLVSGLVERTRGTVELSRLGGLASSLPVVAALFLLPALSLSGIPPLAGFVGKLALLQAAVADAGVLGLVTAGVVLVASLLTLAAMMRVWATVFLGTPAALAPDTDPDDQVDVGTGGRPGGAMLGATVGAVVLGLVIAGAAGPLSALAARAAADLDDRQAYRGAVLGTQSLVAPAGSARSTGAPSGGAP